MVQETQPLPWSVLRDICIQMCAGRTGGDISVFRQSLSEKGIRSAPPKSFADDIGALICETRQNLSRNQDKTAIQLHSARVPIEREMLSVLTSELAERSVFVTGEPGCGKTGLLVSAADQWLSQGKPVVFLSVDRHPVATPRQLSESLQLSHSVAAALDAWSLPGQEPGLVIIDALDAARGGSSEKVFRNLVEEIADRLGQRWRICVSIRTFDLKNSITFRELSRFF